MEDQVQNAEKEKKYQNVYFIENHIETAKVKIEFYKNYTQTSNLKSVKNGVYDVGGDNKYLFYIYQFELYTEMVQERGYFDIDIKLKDENNKEDFKKKILKNNFNNDIFIFDFKFDINKSWTENKEPPKSFHFSHEEQLNIYSEYIQKDLKLKQESRQNEGLVLSALKVLDNETNFEFTFYILIFMECFKTNLILLYLTSFKPEKNTILSTISEKKLKQIINILNIYI